MIPKTSSYHNDGTGRDSYIGVNSGGLKTTFRPLCNVFNTATNLNRASDMKFRLKKYKPSNLKIIQTGVKYHGDGTGRDQYVLSDYGGTVKIHKSRAQILKDYTINKEEAKKNKSRSQKSFTGMPTFTRKRPEFHDNPIHKVISNGGVLQDLNNPYPPQVSINRAETVAQLKRQMSQGGNKFGYSGEWSAANLSRKPFKHSQSLDPRKWQQILSKNFHLPHVNY